MRSAGRSVLALLLTVGCASSTNGVHEPEVAQAQESPEQAARRRENERRKARENELQELIWSSNLVAMNDATRSRIRAVSYGEIAQLRFEGGDVDGALQALDLALEAGRSTDDGKVRAALFRTHYLILRFSALEAAKVQNYDRSMQIFDRIATLPGLSADDRNQAAGDRLMIIEMRGDSVDKERDRALQAALSRILGEDDDLPREEKPVHASNYELDSERVRLALSREIGREVAQARLPTTSDVPQAETGRMDPSTVLRVVSANKRSITGCYDAALRAQNNARGKLELSLIVEPSGDVSEVKILSAQFARSNLGRCIADTVGRWKFPPFAGEPREVELPLVLDYLQ